MRHQPPLGTAHTNAWYFMKINEKIRLLREAHNFTQEEMAHKLSLSTNGYANIERGETKLHLERLEEIAHIFGIEVTDLISFGERNIIFNDNSTNNGFNITGEMSDKSWIVELSKLQMIVQHKDEIIQQKNQEIDTLRMLVEVLKAK